MPTADPLRQVLESYREKEKKLLEELQRVRVMVHQMETDLGEMPPSSEIPLNIADSLPPMTDRAEVAMANGRRPNIRPDEFFGMTQAEAARSYLKRVGHAISFEELVSALQAGGCKVGGENPKKILYISLVRNTRDFVPPQTGFIGLREFYPAGAGRPPKEKVKHAKKRGRTSKKRGRPRKSAETPKKSKTEKEKSPFGPVVRAVLNDKQERTIDELVTAVSAKVGRPVKKISLVGVLRSGDFEKIDGGKYRLVK